MLRCTILVAIGCNLPGPQGEAPLETCRWAIQRLRTLPGAEVVAVSRWYRTRPVPASDQPDYINGIVRLCGPCDPAGLLAGLHAIEAEAGRVRTVRNAARPLDLDLLGVGDLVIDGPHLTLPHPRLHLRGFVLAPLCDIAPGWVHPVFGRRAADMLAEAGWAGVEVLPDADAPSDEGGGAVALAAGSASP